MVFQTSSSSKSDYLQAFTACTPVQWEQNKLVKTLANTDYTVKNIACVVLTPCSTFSSLFRHSSSVPGRRGFLSLFTPTRMMVCGQQPYVACGMWSSFEARLLQHMHHGLLLVCH